MNKKTNEKGITLIALVVTIIVLLILAGVSINLLAGGDGIMAKAQSAIITNNVAEAKERVALRIAEYQTDYYRAVYVEKTVSVNTEMGDWIAQTHQGEILKAGDYEFQITGAGAPYTVTILKNNKLKNQITGTLLDTGKIIWDEIEGGTDDGEDEPTIDPTPDPNPDQDQQPATKYTVSYELKGGTGSVPADVEYIEGATVNVEFPEDLAKEGFAFLGWATTADATTAIYTNEGIKTFEMSAGKVILYAVWEEVVTVPEEFAVGSEVTYIPSGVYEECKKARSGANIDYKFASGTAYNSSDSTLTDMTISSWKVFKINESTGEVQLVPSSPTTNSVWLYGANGYNNSVKLLNDACSALYANETKGIDARSINITDIEEVLNYDPTTYSDSYSQYDKQNSAYTLNKTYPKIYETEKRNVIDGTENEGTLGKNDPADDWVLGTVTAQQSIRPYCTRYNLEYSDFSSKLDAGYADILLPNGEDTSYWVASRSISCSKIFCGFCVGRVWSGLTPVSLYCSNETYQNSGIYPLFPIVSLDKEEIKWNSTAGWKVDNV